MQPIRVTHFTDPGCPWAYSAAPALAALRWRYGDQLDWDLVTIGLTEDARQYVDRGYTPRMMAGGYLTFRERWGMPFATAPKARVAATSRACRAIVVARGQDPRPRRRRAARPAAPAVHDAAAARRRRRAAPRARGGRGPRRRRRRRRDRRSRGRRGLRGRPRPGAHGRGRRDAVAGQGRELRRALALHRAVARLHPRRAVPGGGRLPVARGLRRPAGELQPAPGAARRAGRRARGARRRAAGAHHGRGGRGAAPRQRRARPPRRRGGARRGGRRRRGGAAWRPAATRCGSRRATPRARRACSRRGPSPRSAASSRCSPRGRRPRPACPRSRGRPVAHGPGRSRPARARPRC